MVVVRWVPVLQRWHVSHAETYQNAIRGDGWKTRAEAIAAAEARGMTVTWHPADINQPDPSPRAGLGSMIDDLDRRLDPFFDYHEERA